MAATRTIRNNLLAACDWTQVLDAPADKDVWADYRQALRDVPEQAGFPAQIEWPLKSEKIVSDRLAEIATLTAYLSSTDWYAVRKAETGKAVPEDVILARQQARDRISELHEAQKIYRI
jgi:hypothetical protein